MQRIHGLVLSLFVFPLVSLAASPVTEQKFAAFQSAVKKLNEEIGTAEFKTLPDGKEVLVGSSGFLELAEKCNPPMSKKDLIEGFGNPRDKLSAKSLLGIHEKDVSEHVFAGESSFQEIKDDVMACKDRSALLTKSDEVTKKLQKDLGDDLANYKLGVAAADKKRPLLMGVLKMGTMSPSRTAESSAACTAALGMIAQMDASNAAVQKSLAELHASYSDRLLAEQASINAPQSCGPVRRVNHERDASEPATFERDADEVIAI